MVDKYSWVDIGSSYLPSDIQAAYLWGQLEKAEEINHDRLCSWNTYDEALQPLAEAQHLILPTTPEACIHNGHMYYLKTANLTQRTALLGHLKERDVMAAFHYVPLHSAIAGRQFSRFSGEDCYTSQESERLIRLPIWYGIQETERSHIIQSVIEFYA